MKIVVSNILSNVGNVFNSMQFIVVWTLEVIGFQG